ncbi:unnamed protein product [Brassica rapa subsp. trilocularis]
MLVHRKTYGVLVRQKFFVDHAWACVPLFHNKVWTRKTSLE